MLRPPSHRGPLIASGAVVLTLGLVLHQIRLESWSNGAHLVLLTPIAALLLWLGIQARLEGGRPPAFQSALLVCGLILLAIVLVRLADALGADLDEEFPAGAATWTTAVEAGVAAFAAARRNSAICALIAAVAAGASLLSAANWIFGADTAGTFRVLLLLLAIVFAIASLPLRAISLRHAQQMVNAAGLAILSIAGIEVPAFVFGFGADSTLPGFWELIVLGGGFGLVAYAAADRAPGPAYLGTLVLAVFAVLVGEGEATLEWWPLLLLVLGAGAMVIGLRPPRPLPPEPAPYHPDELPLAARTDDDVVVRVHRE